MEPVRIKYYGLLWMTKRAYLIATALGALFLVLACGFFFWVCWTTIGSLPPWHWLWEPPPRPALNFGGWVFNYFYWIILVGVFLETIDIVVVLRRFAQKEAERLRTQARSAGEGTLAGASGLSPKAPGPSSDRSNLKQSP